MKRWKDMWKATHENYQRILKMSERDQEAYFKERNKVLYGIDDDEDDDWYDDDDDDDIPEGCAACGGPYPQCTTSCKLFDD